MNRKQILPAVVGAAIGVAVVALLVGSSLASLLPLAIVLVCPLMMLFMMAGMHHGGDSADHRPGGRGHGSPADQAVRHGRQVD